MTSLTLKEFDYHLPAEFIAQTPAKIRHGAKLLHLDRRSSTINDTKVNHITQILNEGDALVLNETKVFPARLRGRKTTGGKVELLLIKKQSDIWDCISFGNLKTGHGLIFNKGIKAKVVHLSGEGIVQVKFSHPPTRSKDWLSMIGSTPLPPYVGSGVLSEKYLRQRYQTVYAKHIGSSAAPTAGLHFTPSLLHRLKNNGVIIEKITLHVGPGTFLPLRHKKVSRNTLHQEYFSISANTSHRLNSIKQSGGRICAVGTTVIRTLESSVDKHGLLDAKTGDTQLFIYPPYKFKFVDVLMTNFHLPQSSLLMLVSAFTSYPNTNHHFVDFHHSTIGRAYAHARKHNYRFFSFGDAMFIT